jgi:hypothetical protein
MLVSCDISRGNVSVSGRQVTCGSTVLSRNAAGLKVRGTAYWNRISVDDSRISLHLFDTFISAESPITVRRSNVTIVSDGINSLIATTQNYPAIFGGNRGW